MVAEKNFVMLTQIVTHVGVETKRVQKIYPHNKEFLLKKMRLQLRKNIPHHFWTDLQQKDEAKLEDRWGGVIHFQITPINGDYVNEAEIRKISELD
jgi:hypothetical protein